MRPSRGLLVMHYQTAPDFGFLSEKAFIRRLYLEQKRTERSHRNFVFVLIASPLFDTSGDNNACDRIFSVFSEALRETDVRGWYETGAAIGLIFTEIGSTDAHSIGTTLVAKVRGLLERHLSSHEFDQLKFSFYVFPEDWDKTEGAAMLYPESVRKRRAARALKRLIDVGGSFVALIFVLPLFLIIGAGIKLTSKGPVLFRQQRVGRYGRTFTFLKFRSMYVNSDHAIHREYVEQLIAGTVHSTVDRGQMAVFKLTDDPRITPLGRFLRRTSLDELPQFLNVLAGQMSLVGPRPPVPYEVEAYDIWHRRRLLEMKPGITGLWQVSGRSRTSFDEMVRLDLQYARCWSFWVDLNILLRTPRAVIAGDGAY